MDEVSEHVVKGIASGFWLLDVLRLHAEESGELLQGRGGLAVGKPEDGMNMPLFRNAVVPVRNLVPTVLLILVMDDCIGSLDLAAEGLQSLH